MRLEDVFPWGHNLAEYQAMFNLESKDLYKSIVSFADGTSSANSELVQSGCTMVSVDPIYRFNREDISRRLDEMVMHTERYQQGLPSEERQQASDVANSRANATRTFLADFDIGKKQHRYLAEELPGPISLPDDSFDFGLCGHFLLLYDYLGLAFHIAAITEMLRICKDLRIYPTVNLNGQQSLVLDGVRAHFSDSYSVYIQKVGYGFQGMGKQMLRISK